MDILQKEGPARPPWLGSGRSSRQPPLVGGLTALGQNITLSLRKSCAPLVAAMEGRKGMPQKGPIPARAGNHQKGRF
jgi:hypothetical protein